MVRVFMRSSVSGRVRLWGSRCMNVRSHGPITACVLTIPDFEHSSTRRVVSFEILIPPDAIFDSDAKFVFVDGVGRLSHPVKLRARHRPLKSFNPSKQAIIRSTRDGKGPGTDDALSVMLLEDTDTLGVEVEQWAVEYASKFVHAAGPEFQSTTIAVILGTAYVKKDLPEVSHLHHTHETSLTSPTVPPRSSHAARGIHRLRAPRGRKMHNQQIPTLIPLPHHGSNHRHDPISAPPAR